MDRRTKVFIALTAAFIVLNIMDLGITYLLLQHGLSELNPVVLAAMAALGVEIGLVAVKTGMLAVLIPIFVYLWREEADDVLAALLAVTTTIYIVIVAWNLHFLFIIF